MTLPTDNPFHDYTLAQLLAFVHRKHGETGLRQVLDGDPRRPGKPFTKREYLEDAIQELEQLGLTKVSAIATEYTSKCPSIYDVEIPCPLCARATKKECKPMKQRILGAQP